MVIELPVRIQPLTPDDYDSLLRIWRESGLPYKPMGRDNKLAIIVQMSRDPELFLGAFESGEIVGAVIASYDGRRGWINRLAVIPGARGKGVGKQLIGHAERLLRERGALVIGANIERENTPSLQLFESCGFKRHDNILYLSKRDSSEV